MSNRKPKPLLHEEPAMRVCLRCGKRFLSRWIGHRICAHCPDPPGREIKEFRIRSR